MAEQKNSNGESRKCPVCKNLIYINSQDEDFVVDDGKYIHSDCYIIKKTRAKKDRLTVEQCNVRIAQLKTIREQEIHERTIRRKVTDWIFKYYSITSLPTTFYMKLNQIYSGVYEKISRPIPPEDLLDMWQRKRDYLDKLASENAARNKSMNKYQRVNYDLAVLLGKYDDYLKWKIEQEILKAEMLAKNEENKRRIQQQKIIQRKPIPQNDSKIDIASILEEIY